MLISLLCIITCLHVHCTMYIKWGDKIYKKKENMILRPTFSCLSPSPTPLSPHPSGVSSHIVTPSLPFCFIFPLPSFRSKELVQDSLKSLQSVYSLLRRDSEQYTRAVNLTHVMYPRLNICTYMCFWVFVYMKLCAPRHILFICAMDA